MKTKLDLFHAASATAERNCQTKTPLESATLILADFKALAIDDSHYEEFVRIVVDRTNFFKNLASQPLQYPPGTTGTPLPLEAAQ